MQQGCEAAQNKELVYMPREAQHKSVLEFYWAPLHGLLRLSTWTRQTTSTNLLLTDSVRRRLKLLFDFCEFGCWLSRFSFV